jgi:hypothetical protein
LGSKFAHHQLAMLTPDLVPRTAPLKIQNRPLANPSCKIQLFWRMVATMGGEGASGVLALMGDVIAASSALAGLIVVYLAHLMHAKHELKANFCETRSSVSARVSSAD